MNIQEALIDKLLKQVFDDSNNQHELLNEYMQVANIYSKIENSIVVLSDLKENKSYIYYGRIAQQFGILENDDSKEINSIWEDEIFEKVHPDDLLGKHMLELKFFHFIKKLPAIERSNYHIISNMRMKNKSGKYVQIQHRMFYVCSSGNGNPWLSLCLYNYSYNSSVSEIYDGIIVNSATGDVIRSDDKQRYGDILSTREKEILSLIRKGKMSREIANSLSISKHTVDRHRQNILEKLRVNNAMEACRIAELMNLFSK